MNTIIIEEMHQQRKQAQEQFTQLSTICTEATTLSYWWWVHLISS